MSYTTKNGVQEALDLASKFGKNADWYRAMFALARRLRCLSDDHPEQFKPAVKVFCLHTGIDVDLGWDHFQSCWPRVRVKEGEDVLAWAVALARKEGLRQPYDMVESVARHLASRFAPASFILPVAKLATLLNTSQMMISSILGTLCRHGILRVVRNSSFARRQATKFKLGPRASIHPLLQSLSPECRRHIEHLAAEGDPLGYEDRLAEILADVEAEMKEPSAVREQDSGSFPFWVDFDGDEATELAIARATVKRWEEM